MVDSYKSGFEPPGDVEFEDYGQAMKRAASETSLSNSRGESKPEKSAKRPGKLWPFIKKNKVAHTHPHTPLTHTLYTSFYTVELLALFLSRFWFIKCIKT